MKLFCYSLVWLLAAGCAAHKPVTPSPSSLPAWASLSQPVEPFAVGPRLDSVAVAPHRSLAAKLLGRQPAPAVPVVGRIGKKATVSVYYGPAVVSTAAKNAAAGPGAVAAAKADAPVAAAPGAVASDYRKQGQRGGAAASGAGARATATTSKGLSWWWLLAIAVAVVGYGAWRVCRRGFFVL